jgi:succinate-semialdehyde dehydrogenase/glutarate-semialdehyde dehydrogenase
MAGNAIAMKHAPNVPQCADAIEKIVLEAGLPKGLLVNLRISHDEIPSLIGNELISAVTFTGSTRAGRIIAALSGKHLKKCVLELGGSDPFIVLADADIGQAARIGAASRLLNAGQSCIAAKRFIVERAVADDFLDALITELKAAVIGDPMDPKTTVGPLARQDLRDALHDQVLRSIQQGSNCLIGGDLLQRAGWYYPVTLLTEVKSGTAAWEEELFGPVAVVRVVENADEALAAANDSPYGLGAAVFTRDLDRIKAWSADLHAGAVFFNGMVKSDPRLPFGGVKRSGYGRELGKLGILEFVNQKTVWIALGLVPNGPS